MSAKVQALVWERYDPVRFGAPMVMALALGDEADDRGGGISQSISALALKTRQKDRAVRSQLRRLEASGLLVCGNRSTGGAGKFSEYSLNLGLLEAAENPVPNAGLTRSQEPGSVVKNPVPNAGLRTPSNVVLGSNKSNKDVTDQAKYREAAGWMFRRLQALNAKLREPGWSGWCRDIRFMVERDGHSVREVCELFKFANEHPFWQANIESPGKLRKQWNRLLLEKGKAGGPVSAVNTPVQDQRCSGSPSRPSCQARGTLSRGGGKVHCRVCFDELEEAAAHA